MTVIALADDGGLPVLGGVDSERDVSGVKPLASDNFVFWAEVCEFELNTDDAVLVRELAEPMPRSVSPESECCISSESGER